MNKEQLYQDEIHILLVDDDLTRFIFVESLLSENYIVHDCSNGTEAIEYLEKNDPDLIILDALMPEMDGFATCQSLRNNSKTQHTPVLMMTALDDDDSIEKAYQSGVTDFISKPLSHTLLNKKVLYMLRNNETTQRLIKSEQRLNDSQKFAKLAYWEFDTRSEEIIWSLSATDVLGILPNKKHFGLNTLLELVPDDDISNVDNWLKSALKGECFDNIVHKVILKDKTELYVYQQIQADFDEDGNIINLHGVLQDITAMQLAREQIKELAYYDKTTGLPKRNLFQKYVGQSMEIDFNDQQFGSVLCIELTNYDHILDTYGYNTAESLIKFWVNKLLVLLKQPLGKAHHSNAPLFRNRHYLSRLSEIQFTVLLTNISSVEQLAMLAKAITEPAQTFTQVDNQAIILTTAVGISVYPKDANSVEETMRNSHMALGYAKQESADKYKFFDKNMHTKAVTRMNILSAIRGALDNSEFYLVFQPQICIKTHQVHGCEALLRWDNESLGTIPTDTFIKVAEEAGLIIELGEWVFKQACITLKKWIDKNIQLNSLAVNISAKQFAKPYVAQWFCDTAKDIGVPASMIQLEVTESLLMETAEDSSVLEQLKILKQAGFKISIDDFGTGYSSLNYLKQLPIDHLKIDKSFIDEICYSKQDQAIVNAINSMAGKMRLETIVEGVETIEQLQKITHFGCDKVQGYLFSKPLVEEAFETFIQQFNNGM